MQCGNSRWSGPEIKQEIKLRVWRIISLGAVTEVKIFQIHCVSPGQPRGGEDMNEKGQIVVSRIKHCGFAYATVEELRMNKEVHLQYSHTTKSLWGILP